MEGVNDPILGRRLFTDGVMREVYLGEDGRQRVIDPDGKKVHGVWLAPDEVEPDLPKSVPRYS